MVKTDMFHRFNIVHVWLIYGESIDNHHFFAKSLRTSPQLKGWKSLYAKCASRDSFSSISPSSLCAYLSDLSIGCPLWIHELVASIPYAKRSRSWHKTWSSMGRKEFEAQWRRCLQDQNKFLRADLFSHSDSPMWYFAAKSLTSSALSFSNLKSRYAMPRYQPCLGERWRTVW